MKTHDEDVEEVRAALETLARQVSDGWKQQVRALQATLDRQLAAIDTAFERADYKRAIASTATQISTATAQRTDHARQKAEAAAAQALAAIEVELRARLDAEAQTTSALRTQLEEAKREIESARNRASRAEAAQRATAAQHAQTLDDQKKSTSALDAAQAQVVDLQARLKHAQRNAESASALAAAAEQRVQEISLERDELMERVKSAASARTAIEAQYRQLEGVSQKLSQALTQMLRERDPGHAAATDAAPAMPARQDEARVAALKVTAKHTAPQPAAQVPPPPAKRPLQFAEKARDARRVKIRRGIDVTVDGIPGELVDLSTGGAQAILRQAVKPNQLVRLVLLTAAGQIICKGRVVWVVFEQPDTSLSVYRTGVKFADADLAAVESFMHDFCDKPPIQSRHSSGVA